MHVFVLRIPQCLYLQIAEIAEAFQNAVGEDGEMDAYELMNLLNETGFISGDLCYFEFSNLTLAYLGGAGTFLWPKISSFPCSFRRKLAK